MGGSFRRPPAGYVRDAPLPYLTTSGSRRDAAFDARRGSAPDAKSPRRTSSLPTKRQPQRSGPRGVSKTHEVGHDRVEVVLVERHERLGRFRVVTVSSDHGSTK